MTRTLSRSMGAIVEELELNQPSVVTIDDLRGLAARLGLKTDAKVLAARLRAGGWLLATGTRGVWEFAPGAHTGPYGHADPVTVLRAALARRPDVDAALALGTAAWAHGIADRVPSRLDIAVPAHRPAPAGLAQSASVTVFTSHIGYETRKGVPTHRLESVVVHLAQKPAAVRSWQSVEEWLPELASELDTDLLAQELTGRPNTVAVRVGYLLDGLRPDLSETLRDGVGTKVWFGPRGPLRRHNARWQVADTILPFDPSSLPGVDSPS